jgi:hypothetical protein
MMVVSLANRNTPLRASILLLLGLSSLGCGALLGAEFGDFQGPPDAGTAMDVSPTADTSDNKAWQDVHWQEVHWQDVHWQDGVNADATVPPEDVDDGGVAGCAPGEEHDIAACSNCGRYVQICNDRRTWEPPFCRQPPGACAPGTTEQRSCEGDGTQTATCTSMCMWMLDACIHSVCMPNQVEKQPCGRCGAQSRTCELADGGWKWTAFSDCMDEKPCAPSQIDLQTCGRCGARSRVCDNQCSWGTWGSCQNEGECSPGDLEERVCLLTRQTRTCSDRCVWGEWLGLCL